MKKTFIAIAAAAVLASTAANAKPHHQITDAQREHCLTTDNDPDDTEWCVRRGWQWRFAGAVFVLVIIAAFRTAV